MTHRRQGIRHALDALAYRDYRRFAVSLLLTSIGVQLVQTAIFWQVYELTGSALLLGLTGVARAVPHMVLSLVGGVVADRVNRVRLIQTGQAANGVVIGALAVLTLIGAVEVWHLYLVTFLNGALNAMTRPARTAVIPSLVPRDTLVNAVALNATISQLSLIIGPAIAGLVMGVVGLGPAYVLNALAYLVAIVAITGVVIPSVPTASLESPWRSLLEGLTFVRQKPVIISLLLLDLGTTVLGSYRALLPIFATLLGVGESAYGLLSAAPGVGSLLGAGLMLSLGDMRYKGLYVVAGVSSFCLALVMLALSPWFLLSLVGAGLLGLTNAVQVVPRNSAILGMSPDALRGRVEAFRSMLAGGGPPLGYALSGGLAAVLGAPLALVVGAGACAALIAGVVASDRGLRDPALGDAPVEIEPEQAERSEASVRR